MRVARFVVVTAALAWVGACGGDDETESPPGTISSAGGGGASSVAATGASTSSGGGGGEGGSGGAPPADPCSGAEDGPHCGGDLGGLADHASVYTCEAGATTAVMPCQAGCESGACKTIASDPCASAQWGDGAYCGGSLSGGDADTLYQCAGGATQSKVVCNAGCQVQAPGTPDNCKPEGDPCTAATSGDGDYCGSTLGSGDPSVLYTCVGGATSSQKPCANGCQQKPAGEPDVCNPASGQCCVNHPPGVETQPYTACGNGGSHYGIDYGTPIGTPIYAGVAGTVVGSALGFPNCYNGGCDAACWNAFNYVKVKSDCGDPDDATHDLYVYYLHIDSLAPAIANGVHVDQGQLVAYSGNSGCSSGPHIHIETVSIGGGNASLSTCNSVDPATRYCP